MLLPPSFNSASATLRSDYHLIPVEAIRLDAHFCNYSIIDKLPMPLNNSNHSLVYFYLDGKRVTYISLNNNLPKRTASLPVLIIAITSKKA